jgi:hypothetical protein
MTPLRTMTSTKLCSNLGTTAMLPWKLSDDSSFIFILPNGDAQYARMGESVTVPTGTKLAFTGAMTYNQMDVTGSPLVAVATGIYIESPGEGTRYVFNRYVLDHPASATTEIVAGPSSHAANIYTLTKSCTISACILYEDSQGYQIQIGQEYPTSTITISGIPHTPTVPATIVGVSYIDVDNDQFARSMPAGSNYSLYIGVNNNSGSDITSPIYVTVNGTTYKYSFTWYNGMRHWETIPGFTSTGNDTVCASFSSTSDNNSDILTWIEEHPIEVVAASAVAVFGIAYLATRGIKNTTYKRTKK